MAVAQTMAVARTMSEVEWLRCHLLCSLIRFLDGPFAGYLADQLLQPRPAPYTCPQPVTLHL